VSDYQRIAVSLADGVARVELDRPDDLNALDDLTLEELIEVAGELDGHAGVRVVVFSGRGRAFSAGADLGNFAQLFAGPAGPSKEARIRESAELGQRMADAIAGMRAVTICRAHGYVVGGAFVLMAACDFRVVAEDLVMSIPEVDIGIPLTWGAVPRLVSELGMARTRDLVMTCRRFGPGDVPGFVHRVAPAAELATATDELVATLMDKPPQALEMTKLQLAHVARDPIGAAAADPGRFVDAVMHPDFAMAAARYLNRRRSSGD
jgi:enoyl-CoA hydratase/carnithine racemase